VISGTLIWCKKEHHLVSRFRLRPIVLMTGKVSYRAVKLLHIGYKTQSVNAVYKRNIVGIPTRSQQLIHKKA
jgi:hypothetical protein